MKRLICACPSSQCSAPPQAIANKVAASHLNPSHVSISHSHNGEDMQVLVNDYSCWNRGAPLFNAIKPSKSQSLKLYAMSFSFVPECSIAS